jgi:hypothetical protein
MQTPQSRHFRIPLAENQKHRLSKKLKAHPWDKIELTGAFAPSLY